MLAMSACKLVNIYSSEDHSDFASVGTFLNKKNINKSNTSPITGIYEFTVNKVS